MGAALPFYKVVMRHKCVSYASRTLLVPTSNRSFPAAVLHYCHLEAVKEGSVLGGCRWNAAGHIDPHGSMTGSWPSLGLLLNR